MENRVKAERGLDPQTMISLDQYPLSDLLERHGIRIGGPLKVDLKNSGELQEPELLTGQTVVHLGRGRFHRGLRLQLSKEEKPLDLRKGLALLAQIGERLQEAGILDIVLGSKTKDGRIGCLRRDGGKWGLSFLPPSEVLPEHALRDRSLFPSEKV